MLRAIVFSISSIYFTATNVAFDTLDRFPVPSSRQIEWQKSEIEVLVHFGINTFTGREWGGGNERTEIFNPTAVDARQWVLTAKSAGAKGLILVVKHHDGFCLWPTSQTRFSIKNSPWRGGKGDLVREVANACREGGIRFGIYLSPSDLHEPSYGRNSKAYNDFFTAQLRELLTEYGEVSQVFFDGADPVGRHQAYDWQRYYKIIRELQPEAVISIRGPDVRWVGNEIGQARVSEWSVVPLPKPADLFDWPDMTAHDLGSSERIEDAKYLHWYPAVATVSIYRTGWFWREGVETSLRSISELVKIYEETVGRNSGLLLGLAPDKRGLIPDGEVVRLREFGETIRTTFGRNLVQGPGTDIKTNELKRSGYQETITFDESQAVKYVVVQEQIKHGQHIEAFSIELRKRNGERVYRKGTTVGYKRIIKVDVPDVRSITFRVHDARAVPTVTVSAY